MSARNPLGGGQRRAVIEAIRRDASRPDGLERLPDQVLLAAQYALAGRLDDLTRHVAVMAACQTAQRF